MLHACQIEFCHPETGILLRVDCPPPFKLHCVDQAGQAWLIT